MDDIDKYLALHAKGAYREAYAVLRDILGNDPRWSKVGDLYVWCAELELLVTNDVRKAQELLERARELGCHDAASYHSERGFVRWRMGERDEGIQEMEKSVDLKPSVTHLIRLGTALAREGHERALGVLQRVLDQEPKNCMAHVYLGVLACKSGDRGKAILLARRAETLAESAMDFLDIGRLYHELREFESAADAYLKADKLGHARKGELYASLAICYAWLGDKKTGRKYLQWAVKRDPENEYVKQVVEDMNYLMEGETTVSPGG